MCTVSMIGDHYTEKFRREWPQFFQQQEPNIGPLTVTLQQPQVTRQEFDELRRQVGGMVVLLKRAKIYDEKNGEPECQVEEKLTALRTIARLVGVDLNETLKGGAGAPA